jgi:hypothetical protein
MEALIRGILHPLTLRVSASWLLLAALGGGTLAEAQADPTGWPEPTQETLPWTRWWWMGSAVDRPNLTRELETLAEAGFGGVEVTSIYGVHGYEDAFVQYLSPEWVELLLHAAGEARRLGMGIDMPPGSGWRTGGPEVPLADANASLRITVDTVQGGSEWATDLTDRRIDGILAVSNGGRTVELSNQADGSALTTWRAPEGIWRVYTAETVYSGDDVKRPAPGGAGYSIDVFSHRAVTNFLDWYGERVDHSIPSGTLRSLFHDSFEYGGNGSSDIFDTFRRNRGYDLAQHLHALTRQSDEDHVARVKSDYRQTLDEMLISNFLAPLREWAHARGSLSRNQAHGSPGNLLDLYAASDIPETEIFGPLDGTDADPLISKFASSAAHLAGRPLTSAEAMTWLGEHFQVTLDNVKEAADQLFVSGVNHLIYHGTAYSPQEAEWPGWLFYASTQFNARNAFWRDLPAFNRYVTRVQSILQHGEPDNDVLLYWPIFDNWHDTQGMRIDFRVHTPRWFYDRPLGEIATSLWNSGYAFDYVSDRLLADRVGVSGDRLRAGGAEYRIIMVPKAERMPVETFTHLLELVRAGASVAFVGDLPADVPGLHELEERRGRLETAKREIQFGDADESGVRSATLGAGRLFVGDRPEALLQASGVIREAVTDQGARFVRRTHEDGVHYFVTQAGDQPIDDWVRLARRAGGIVLLDPLTGNAGAARTRAAAGGETEVYLQLQPGESIILRSFETPVEAPAWRYIEAAGDPVQLSGAWDVEFVAGGPEFPDRFRTESLGSWTERGGDAERFAGTARYSLRFDAPGSAEEYLLDLGDVGESARVRLNGSELGTLVSRPFRVRTGQLRPTGNELEIEVTNLSSNRIRDLDRRGVRWKIFHDINFVNIDYRPFDASEWEVRPSGLLGPVTLQPLR